MIWYSGPANKRINKESGRGDSTKLGRRTARGASLHQCRHGEVAGGAFPFPRSLHRVLIKFILHNDNRDKPTQYGALGMSADCSDFCSRFLSQHFLLCFFFLLFFLQVFIHFSLFVLPFLFFFVNIFKNVHTFLKSWIILKTMNIFKIHEHIRI